jgi:hypothetical protein
MIFDLEILKEKITALRELNDSLNEEDITLKNFLHKKYE